MVRTPMADAGAAAVAVVIGPVKVSMPEVAVEMTMPVVVVEVPAVVMVSEMPVSPVAVTMVSPAAADVFHDSLGTGCRVCALGAGKCCCRRLL